ncbi:MAG: 3'-phosphoesterase [Candidatus Babeliaceae bacterium]|nr:3'-phosphoesterase [Candidatus Babeliaceae bacterium]
MSVSKKLKQYASKRSFDKTPEPKPEIKESQNKNVFVIQEHHARQLHYDFRLEIDGVLKSWAVPKGPSTDPREKRLAALTEDHPLEYAYFEGIIPQGYGAGTVIVWDVGTYDNITEKNGKQITMSEAFDNGHIVLFLHGKKLRGGYAITKFRENDWLLVKMDDQYADARRNPVNTEPESVLSGVTIKELDKKFKREQVEHAERD